MRYRLWLDDERWPPGQLGEWPEWEWVVARNFDDATWYVENYGLPYHVAFDHDLGAKKMTGMDFAVWLCEYIQAKGLELPEGFSYSVHSFNPAGAANIENRMRSFLEYR